MIKITSANFATMNRSQYYSQTELLKTFKISLNKLNELVDKGTLQPKTQSVNLGTYSVVARYFDKVQVDTLRLERR